MDIKELYLNKMLSIPQIHRISGISLSTIRNRLKQLGVLRSRKEGIQNAANNGLLGSGLRGKTRIFSDETKKKISQSRLKWAEKNAIGISYKTNGYAEFTNGKNKGRGVHVVIIEQKIGRKLFSNEVVHHIDGNKHNNDVDNLQLMTRSEHSKLHILEKLKENQNGIS